MTIVVPCRLITRQRSHIGFTDALTFIGTKPPSFLGSTAPFGSAQVPGFLPPGRIAATIHRLSSFRTVTPPAENSRRTISVSHA